MSKIYFLKQGVSNQLTSSSGQPFKFEKLADNQGVIELDETENASEIADLRGWIKRKLGGVSEIDQAKFEDVKKNLSLADRPAPRNPGEPQIRLFTAETDMDKLAREDREASALRAAAQVVAPPVAERSLAESAKAGEPSKGPRIGKAKGGKHAAAPAEPVTPVAIGTEEVEVRILSDEPVTPVGESPAEEKPTDEPKE
jgi:hypothetical protein